MLFVFFFHFKILLKWVQPNYLIPEILFPIKTCDKPCKPFYSPNETARLETVNFKRKMKEQTRINETLNLIHTKVAIVLDFWTNMNFLFQVNVQGDVRNKVLMVASLNKKILQASENIFTIKHR